MALSSSEAQAVLPGVPDPLSEAPELHALAARGEIPPVAARLPRRPMVLEPGEEIGVYGGVWRRAHLRPKDACGVTYLLKETLLLHAPDYGRLIPNVCESFEMSEDGRSFTFHLREGMRWSDGTPFTADDYLFWYEDVACNQDLSPVFPVWLTRGGTPMKMAKVDNHAFRIDFTEPYAALPDYLAGMGNPTLYLPKHYAKQFHPRYTTKADLKQKVEDGGFRHWVDLFRRKTYSVAPPECPSISAWLAQDEISGQVQRWRRNPYYWKVDPDGKQLPYIDAIHSRLVADPETVVLKAAAGEIDMQVRRVGGTDGVGTENYSLLMENRARGGYRVILRDISRQSKFAILFNYHHREQRLRRLLNDLRFRISLSHALDRDELNEFCMQGLGEPSQVMPNPESRWFDEDAARLYLEHDNKKADCLLDELGLTWDRQHRYRHHPNGDVVVLNMKVTGPLAAACELIREQWSEVGIKLIVTPVESHYWYRMLRAGHYDLTATGVKTGSDGCFMHLIAIPPYYSNCAAPQWDLWARTNQRVGEEPPDWFKYMLGLVDEILGLPQCGRRVELVKTMQRISIENLLRIGCLTAPPQATFAVVGNSFRNVPDPLPNLTCCHPATFFFKQGRDDGREHEE